MKKIVMLAFMAFAGSVGYVSAQAGGVILTDKSGWHRIGEKTVDFARERDEINVVSADRFAKIKFMVKDAPIQLNQLEFAYESGDNQVVKVNSDIKAAGESRVIDIKGSERDLKKIMFTYHTIKNSKDKKASVEVWGLKTNADKNETGAVKPMVNEGAPANTAPATVPTNPVQGVMNPDNTAFGKLDTNRVSATPAIVMSDETGWHKIAERTVDFSVDRDEVMVLGANRFSSIRFRAMDAPINIMDILLNYDKGDKQAIATRVQLDPGKESRDFALNNGLERDLKRISFFYNTVPNYKDKKAVIEIWGYKTNLDKSHTTR